MNEATFVDGFAQICRSAILFIPLYILVNHNYKVSKQVEWEKKDREES